MTFRLIDARWAKVFDDAVHVADSKVRIVSPFISRKAVERILKHGKPATLRVITRFNLDDFCAGVSEIDALQLLQKNGAQIRGIRNLHAKLYLFGSRAIATSANLTEQALCRNHEFGFESDDPDIVARCSAYFEHLWTRAGHDLTLAKLSDWKQRVTDYLARGTAVPTTKKLGDEGADVGISADLDAFPPWVASSSQAFVKFFGEGHNRADRSMAILEEVRRSGCHWACTYPLGKRPRSVEGGATVFMGRLVKDPHDTLVYGRAIAMPYVEGRDDATAAEISVRPWKARWPHYIRVHHVEFIDSSLSNGVSLGELMDALGANSFASTQLHLDNGQGANTNPRRAYLQQAAVRLTPQATQWLNERLEQAFGNFGRIPPAVLQQLDQPTPFH